MLCPGAPEDQTTPRVMFSFRPGPLQSPGELTSSGPESESLPPRARTNPFVGLTPSQVPGVPAEMTVSLTQTVFVVPSAMTGTPTFEFSKKTPVTGILDGLREETGKVVPVFRG